MAAYAVLEQKKQYPDMVLIAVDGRIGRAAFVEQLLQSYYCRLARIEGYGGDVYKRQGLGVLASLTSPSVFVLPSIPKIFCTAISVLACTPVSRIRARCV